MNKQYTMFRLIVACFLVSLAVQFFISSVAFASSKSDIVVELITLKNKDKHLQLELSQLDKRLRSIDGNLNKLNNQIIDTEFTLNKEIKVLSFRAKAIYKDRNNQNTLQVILESKSVYDLITKLDFFSRILKEDFKLLRKSKLDRTKLINLKKNFIQKREKIVVLKETKQRASQEYKAIRIKLQTKLKIASKKQLVLVEQGINNAKFYDDYLASIPSPMAGLGITLVTTGRQYNINPAVIVGIAGLESGYGAHNANSYNAWGRKSRGGGYMGFASWEDSVKNQIKYLREKYFNQGRTTPVSIGKKYAPGNGSWPGKLNTHLNKIKSFKLSYR